MSHFAGLLEGDHLDVEEWVAGINMDLEEEDAEMLKVLFLTLLFTMSQISNISKPLCSAILLKSPRSKYEHLKVEDLVNLHPSLDQLPS